MTVLSDKDIKLHLKNKKINITPQPTQESIQPASVDLKLGNEFKTFTSETTIDPTRVQDLNKVCDTIHIEPNNSFIIHPGQFVLATTLEKVTLPDDIVARVEGRSSIGRLGITMHVTAGYIDPGFEFKR